MFFSYSLIIVSRLNNNQDTAYQYSNTEAEQNIETNQPDVSESNSLEPEVHSLINTSNYSVGSPEWALANYVNAWSNQDWQEMAKYTQPFWKNKYENPEEQLKGLSDFVKSWKSFDINNVGEIKHIDYYKGQYVNFTGVDITFTILYESWTNTLVKTQIKARLVKENEEWGVNPDSILEENRISETKL